MDIRDVDQQREERVRNVHTAYNGNVTQFAISWFTRMPTSTPTVHFGLNSSNYTNTAFGVSTTYNTSVGYYHHVLLTNLEALTEYVYICGDNNSWSEELSFKTAPDVAFQKPVIIPTFGDMGVNHTETTIPHLINIVQKTAVDMIIHVGDISYADDFHAWQFENVWLKWFDLMEPVLNTVPYMVCPGNHEAVCGETPCQQYTGHFAPYNHIFRMPGTESGSNTNMYQSFNYAGIHFVAIDTETDFPGAPEADQGGFGNVVAWLKQDLASVDRAKYPWIIVFGHRPIYSTAFGFADLFGYPMDACAALQAAVEDLFHTYKVDLYISGHVHAYERNYPVYQSIRVGNDSKGMIVNPQATVHLIAGAAGSDEGLSNNEWFEWTVGSDSWSYLAHRYGVDYGYGMMSIENSTHLHWQYFRSGDNGLEDEFWIVKTDSSV